MPDLPTGFPKPGDTSMKFDNGYTVPEKLKSTTERKLFSDNFMVSDVFDLDGRDEEEYGHIFGWEDLTDPIWSEGGYSIRGCVGFEPDCVVLLDDGSPVGFYMGGQAWVDTDHRGHGFGAKMIVACIAMSGSLPPVRDIGFSAAGFAAHRNALAIIQEMKKDARPA
jgi:GNAT superfamily N-acetyltransferase